MRAFILALSCIAAVHVHPQYFEWTQLPSFPGGARDDASAFTIGNTIYVGTGRAVSFALTNDWYAFDRVNQTWTAVASLPASGRQYCSAFTDGEFGYLFGGIDAIGPLTELWRYDPALDTWSAMMPLPAGGRYATVAFNNGMVCTGLLAGGIATNECWRYDTENNSWSAKAPAPGPPRHRAAGSGDDVFVIGGKSDEGVVLNDANHYSSATDSWSTSSNTLPGPRFGADAIFDHVQGTIYLVGGASSDTEFHAECWNGEPWSPIAEFAGGPRRGGVIAYAALGFEQDIYYGTGVDDTQRYADWWVYRNLSEGMAHRQRTRLHAFPNPSTGILTVDLPAPATFVSVHDITGRMLLVTQPGQQGKLDLTALGTGEYLIRIVVGDQHYFSRTSIIRP